MKVCGLRKYLSVCLMAIPALVVMRAEDISNKLIVEGREWNYVVNFNPGLSSMTETKGTWIESGYHFEGERESDGKTYSIFRDGEGNEVAYMREESGKVYLKIWQEGDPGWGCSYYIENYSGEEPQEVLVYDFNLNTGETAEMVGFDDSYLDLCEECSVTVTATGTIENCGNIYHFQNIETYPGSNFKVIEGLGINKGLLCRPQISGNCTTNGRFISYYLMNVKDSATGNIIYEDAEVARIGMNRECDNTAIEMYNLQGMPIDQAEPGTIVIRNGRKYIMPK